MQQYPIRFGKPQKEPRRARGADAANSRYEETRYDGRNVLLRAAVLAICGSIVCISFFAYSVAPREEAVVPAMAYVGHEDSAVPVVAEQNDGSIWSYIEGVIRGVIDDADD